MQRFFVIGTVHIADPRLLHAIEAALDASCPDQLILEMPDDVAISGDVALQKPEMVHAYHWALKHGVPVRGHEPSGPSILRDHLPSERIGELVQEMEGLIAELTPRRTIDVFCQRGSPETQTESRLGVVIDALVDRDRALLRTEAIIANVLHFAAREGDILILCGGNHVPQIVAALEGCQIIGGEHFY